MFFCRGQALEPTGCYSPLTPKLFRLNFLEHYHLSRLLSQKMRSLSTHPLLSVYLKSVSSSCQSLCIGQVSFSDIATCSSLSSSGITHLQRYYGTIRLPIFLLSLFLLLTRHTLLLFSKAEKI